MADQRKQVLVVDGDRKRRAHVVRLLRGARGGCMEPAEAASGQQALSRCLISPPACLLTACRLEDMDAVAILTALQLDQPEAEPPVVVLGEPDDALQAAEAIKAGAYDFLPFPKINGGLLRRIIQNAMERAELMRQITRQRIELEQGHEALLGKHHELEQLAAIVSQELQQPLASIHAYLELLADDSREALSPLAREWVAASLAVTHRMSARLRDLLDYATVDSQGKPFSQVDCDSAFRCALQHLEQAVERSQATVTHGQLPKIVGDDHQLCRLFQNLLAYGMKSAEDGPVRVHVSARKREGEWLFAVEHRGGRRNQLEAEHIFSAAKPSPHGREYAGRGVPLAVCKKIVQRHGGRIWVEAASGRRWVFSFTLPATQSGDEARRLAKAHH